MKTCICCDKTLTKQQLKYCSNSCSQKMQYQKNRDKKIKYQTEKYNNLSEAEYQHTLEVKRRSYQKTKHIKNYAVKRAERRALQFKATPKWADLDDIANVYLEATYLQMEVDHIYPLKSNFVCGLHVVENLQLLPRKQNRAKRNSIPTDEYVNSLA